MYLVRLIYVSKKSKHFLSDDIGSILESARRNNGAKAVTGVLCFNRKYFLQCLEGSRENVNYLLQKIYSDRRHENLMILGYGEINERQFDHWSMGYVAEASLTKDTLLKFSESNTFDPYCMTAESATGLLYELSETAFKSGDGA